MFTGKALLRLLQIRQLLRSTVSISILKSRLGEVFGFHQAIEMQKPRQRRTQFGGWRENEVMHKLVQCSTLLALRGNFPMTYLSISIANFSL